MRPVFRDPHHQACFEQEGFVQLRLLEPSDIERLTALHDGRSAHVTAGSAWSFTAMTNDAVYRRAMSDGIKAAMQPRLDRVMIDCRAAFGNFFHKQPSADESVIHLHQDWSWVDETKHHALSIWCPFQPVDESNGTLAVIPRSHLLSHRPRGFVTAFPYPGLEQFLVSRYSRHLALAAGDAVFFHQRLFHWSGPNRTASRRLAANCFVAPAEAPLAFPHPDPAHHRLELFEADDELLTSFTLGQRPEGVRSLGFVDATVEPLDEATVERILGSATGTAG